MNLPMYIYYHTDYDNDSLPRDGGEGVTGVPLTEDLLPELQDKNYLFRGWYSTPTFDLESKVIVGNVFDEVLDLHLYAKWIPKNELGNKMTLLANEIRELSGTTAAIGLDTMKTHVSEANNEVESQTKLLTQIIAALKGKAGGDIETCTVTVIVDDVPEAHPSTLYLEYTDGDQNYVCTNTEVSLKGSIYSLQIAKNSLFVINPGWNVAEVQGVNYNSSTDDLTNSIGEMHNLFRITSNATIHIFQSSGSNKG